MASTQLLLDTLSNNLSDDIKELLKDSEWNSNALNYLDELLNSDNIGTLLDSNTPTPSNNDDEKIGISQQIAELSSQSIIIDNKIINKLNSNSNSNLSLILDCDNLFKDSFDNFDNLILLTKELVGINSISNWKFHVSIINSNLGIYNNKSDNNKSDNNKSDNNNNNNNNNNIKIMKYNNELSLILQNLQNLTEILELSSITHSLIKLGQYSECIEISSLSKRLKIRYNDIELINQIDDNITFEINDMIKKLSNLLMTNLKQSSMIKILSYLKRIINNKEQLKSIFFHSRYKFIIDEFETLIPLKQSKLIEKYLKRILEIFREFCFQTIITFDSVFDKDKHLTFIFLKSISNKLCDILVENLPLLNNNIDEINNNNDNDTKNNYDSLLLQLIYCCQSLSRIGGDFTISVIERLKPIVDKGQLLSIVKKQKELVRSLNRV